MIKSGVNSHHRLNRSYLIKVFILINYFAVVDVFLEQLYTNLCTLINITQRNT